MKGIKELHLRYPTKDFNRLKQAKLDKQMTWENFFYYVAFRR